MDVNVPIISPSFHQVGLRPSRASVQLTLLKRKRECTEHRSLVGLQIELIGSSPNREPSLNAMLKVY